MPVAESAEVTTVPRPVEVAGRAFVAVRLAEDAPASLVAQLCPHRLVPLSAASVTGGRLRCAYHGWEFDESGTCVVLPSLGEQANIPPRAHLAAAPRAKEEDGRLWACVSDLPAAGGRAGRAAQHRPAAARGLAPGRAVRRGRPRRRTRRRWSACRTCCAGPATA